MATLEEMCPRVEIYSIDEAFCDLTGVRNCRVLEEFGHELKDTVYRNTGLPVGGSHKQRRWQNSPIMRRKHGKPLAE